MTALVGPLTMICGVLAVAGLAKVVSPLPTRSALTSIGLTVPAPAVRVLGSIEVALAVATVVVGGTVLPMLVGAVHLVFAGVVALIMRRGGPSCGCFGSLDTPVSGLHIGSNLVAAAVAFAAVGAAGLTDVLADQPGAGVAYVVAVMAGTAAAVSVLTLLPRLAPHTLPAPAFSLRGGE